MKAALLPFKLSRNIIQVGARHRPLALLPDSSGQAPAPKSTVGTITRPQADDTDTSEAAKYRRRLRDAEAQREFVSTRLTTCRATRLLESPVSTWPTVPTCSLGAPNSPAYWTTTATWT